MVIRNVKDLVAMAERPVAMATPTLNILFTTTNMTMVELARLVHSSRMDCGQLSTIMGYVGIINLFDRIGGARSYLTLILVVTSSIL
jgi:hypothetical protein